MNTVRWLSTKFSSNRRKAYVTPLPRVYPYVLLNKGS